MAKVTEYIKRILRGINSESDLAYLERAAKQCDAGIGSCYYYRFNHTGNGFSFW